MITITLKDGSRTVTTPSIRMTQADGEKYAKDLYGNNVESVVVGGGTLCKNKNINQEDAHATMVRERANSVLSKFGLELSRNNITRAVEDVKTKYAKAKETTGITGNPKPKPMREHFVN